MSARSRDDGQQRYREIRVTVGFPNAPTVERFVQDRSRYAAIMGPYGSAKTTGVVHRIRAHMVEQEPNSEGIRPSRWLATRTTYKELTSTTMKDVENLFRGCGQMKLGSGMEPPKFLYHWRNPDGTESKGEIIFVALDHIETAIQMIAGFKLTGAWVNEASGTAKAILDTLGKRVGRYPLPTEGGVRCTWKGVLLDTNAMDESHWYYKLAEEDKPRGWTFFRQPGALIEKPGEGRLGKSLWVINSEAENLANVGEDYYLDGLEGIDDDWIRVKLGNEYGFTVDGKPVHPEYVDSVHCLKEPPEVRDAPIFLGQDYGRTPATVVAQFDESQGRTVAIAEFYDEDISAQSYAPELKLWLDRKFKGLPIGGGWGDPAGGDGNQSTDLTPIQIMCDNGIPIEPAPTNDPLLRRGAVRGPLKRMAFDGLPSLFVSPDCRMLRKGLMGGYCYRKLRTVDGHYSEKPDKNEYSHLVEALEYLELGLGESASPRELAPHAQPISPYAIQ
ncbi:MAG: TerL [bacterium]|nr:TerL [bacterium]